MSEIRDDQANNLTAKPRRRLEAEMLRAARLFINRHPYG